MIMLSYQILSLAAITLREVAEKVGIRTLFEIVGIIAIVVFWLLLQRSKSKEPPQQKQKMPREGLADSSQRFRKPRFQKQSTSQAAGSIERFNIETLLNATHIVDLWEVIDTKAVPPMHAVISVVKSAKDAVVAKKISRAVNLLSGFSHPNIVSFLGEGVGPCTGEWEQYKRYGNEVYYVVSEYIQGGTLKERLAIEEGQKIPIVEALYIAIDVLYALEFLAYLNLIHRNLKPANIMVDRRGVAKITGFHLLKEVRDTSSDTEEILTREGVSLGTPEYMSLDQCKDAAHVDARSDIYSLGVVLYQMLTGISPFKGKNLNETFKNIKDLAIPPVCSLRPEVPPELEEIVSRTIERDINRRYQTPTEFRRALEALF